MQFNFCYWNPVLLCSCSVLLHSVLSTQLRFCSDQLYSVPFLCHCSFLSISILFYFYSVQSYSCCIQCLFYYAHTCSVTLPSYPILLKCCQILLFLFNYIRFLFYSSCIQLLLYSVYIRICSALRFYTDWFYSMLTLFFVLLPFYSATVL